MYLGLLLKNFPSDNSFIKIWEREIFHLEMNFNCNKNYINSGFKHFFEFYIIFLVINKIF